MQGVAFTLRSFSPGDALHESEITGWKPSILNAFECICIRSLLILFDSLTYLPFIEDKRFF